jgi:hypothetical protein
MVNPRIRSPDLDSRARGNMRSGVTVAQVVISLRTLRQKVQIRHLSMHTGRKIRHIREGQLAAVLESLAQHLRCDSYLFRRWRYERLELRWGKKRCCY